MKYVVRFFLFCGLILLNFRAQAQYGYVKLETDSFIRGFIRPFRDVVTAEEGLEIWKTKNDRKPTRIFKESILEYAIKKDTIKILHKFTPFLDDDLFFDKVDARYIQRGKINLLKVRNPQYRAQGLMIPSQPSMAPAMMVVIPTKFGEYPFIYILEDPKNDKFVAMPPKKKDFRESLLIFFSESFLSRYEQKYGKIKHKTIQKFVEFCNSK
ncbi:MAG: hypothetical protein HY015_00110 [Bacteroidetes bacterium]|nr:hypothetical protein [Bacteroidota bacterium]MBI3481383.1 hypothetical protein [Bacteroidota bacterium]